MRTLNQTVGLAFDSFLQFRRRLVVVFSVLFITITLLTFLFGMDVERGAVTGNLLVHFPLEGMDHEMTPDSFTRMMLGFAVFPMMFFGFFLLLFSTSGLLPEVLRGQGKMLFLSKPLPRWLVLAVKFAVVDLIVVFFSAYYYYGLEFVVRWHLGSVPFWPHEPLVMILAGYQCALALGVLFGVMGAKAGLSLFLNALSGFLSITSYTVMRAEQGLGPTARKVWATLDFLTPPYGEIIRSADAGPSWLTGAKAHALMLEWSWSALEYTAVVLLIAVAFFSWKEHGK